MAGSRAQRLSASLKETHAVLGELRAGDQFNAFGTMNDSCSTPFGINERFTHTHH